jgi:hypothetical protein
MLAQILCFWALSIVLSFSKNRPVYFSKHDVSKASFCLHLQVKTTQLGIIDRASPYLLNGTIVTNFWILSAMLRDGMYVKEFKKLSIQMYFQTKNSKQC